MSNNLPTGFRAAGVYTGVKRKADKLDLSLIVSDAPAVAAGVFTQNLVFAAPVKLCRERTPSEAVRAIVINSGNANACTGDQGDRDAATMAATAAGLLKVDPRQVLVMSTGVIGDLMPMDKVVPGIHAAASQLGTDEAALIAAARGMMTTDTRTKISSRTIDLDGCSVCVCGIAKGAAPTWPRCSPS
jgi:glutamate N-acetyltransferase/amino-acid N-acetyltransferase